MVLSCLFCLHELVQLEARKRFVQVYIIYWWGHLKTSTHHSDGPLMGRYPGGTWTCQHLTHGFTGWSTDQEMRAVEHITGPGVFAASVRFVPLRVMIWCNHRSGPVCTTHVAHWPNSDDSNTYSFQHSVRRVNIECNHNLIWNQMTFDSSDAF